MSDIQHWMYDDFTFCTQTEKTFLTLGDFSCDIISTVGVTLSKFMTNELISSLMWLHTSLY